MSVRPPRAEHHYQDREIDCQEAMELLLAGVIHEVELANWRRAEILDAVEALVESFRDDDDRSTSEPSHGNSLGAEELHAGSNVTKTVTSISNAP